MIVVMTYQLNNESRHTIRFYSADSESRELASVQDQTHRFSKYSANGRSASTSASERSAYLASRLPLYSGKILYGRYSSLYLLERYVLRIVELAKELMVLAKDAAIGLPLSFLKRKPKFVPSTIIRLRREARRCSASRFIVPGFILI